MTSALAGRAIIGSTTGAAHDRQPGRAEPLFLDYQNRLDLRVGKTFRFDQTKIQGFADIFNVFNAGTVLRSTRPTARSRRRNAWMTPTTIMQTVATCGSACS